ncbi:MAG: hypothetical protein NTW00_06570 [Hyphomicrobiales bacterium]|nr:hypothetical protein [Hyphomicrobiales bacterium]
MMTAAASATPGARNLLERFSQIRDTWQPCKVLYPLSEVLLLVVLGTMAACDGCDYIVCGDTGICRSCAGCRSIITAFPAPIGCGS